MDEVECISRTAVCTTESGSKVTRMAKERTHTGMATFMKENGRVTGNTEKECTRTNQVIHNSKVFFLFVFYVLSFSNMLFMTFLQICT